jgi:hypothetical protein
VNPEADLQNTRDKNDQNPTCVANWLDVLGRHRSQQRIDNIGSAYGIA